MNVHKKNKKTRKQAMQINRRKKKITHLEANGDLGMSPLFLRKNDALHTNEEQKREEQERKEQERYEQERYEQERKEQEREEQESYDEYFQAIEDSQHYPKQIVKKKDDVYLYICLTCGNIRDDCNGTSFCDGDCQTQKQKFFICCEKCGISLDGPGLSRSSFCQLCSFS